MKNEQDRTQELIFGYFAGILSPEEEQELTLWLQADESHRKQYSDEADLWAMAHVPRFANQKQTNFETHFQHIKKEQSRFSILYRKPMNSLLKVAAALILLLATGTTAYLVGTHYASSPQTIALFKTTAPLGAKSKVVLPDGSVVWINSGSSLSYTSNFNSSVREVSLVGEAYFEVTHNPSKPFVVKANSLDVKVLGTHFNVKAYQNEETVDVSLISGKVNVHLNSQATHNADVILRPNHMLSFNKDNGKVEVANIKGTDANAWINGMLTFTKQPFVNIAKDLERKYNIRLVIQSKNLQREIFSGSFASNYSLEQILDEIDVDGKYKWERHDSELIIKDK